MKKLKLFKTILVTILLLVTLSPTLKAHPINEVDSSKHTIQLNALELVGHLYSAIYSYQFSPKNHLMLGLAYQNFRYDFGTVHAPTIIIGYKRFFWKGINVDLTLWPAYNSFYEKNEKKYYEDFEVWSEIRLGYEFNFKIKGLSLFVCPQLITGTALVEGKKPQSFLDYYKTQQFAGNIAFGIHF